MDTNAKLLTIGQFAALHGINKKTLMWYDEIGLFKPALIHPENGYRYYNYHQSALLETILMLRELDVPVSEIQTFIAHRSAETLQKLLDKNILLLDKKIAHMQAMRKNLSTRRQHIEHLLHMDLSEIRRIKKDASCLVTVPIDKQTSYDEQVEMILEETQKYQLRRLHDASYGTMISVKSLLEKQFEDYSSLFIEIPFPIQSEGLHMQPAGDYLQAFYQGDWNQMSAKYEEIFSYAKDHNLQLSGYSYEMIINDNVTESMENYIVQIEIPVCSDRILL
ncbi:MerR family transcriptional regulator [Anaerotruncus sp. 80]|uniref:MerR family transcriptional regulator n=1 Tax=Anaerotruncus colihominis TaxID=169435 RepID=A0A845QGJ5_9FIRM|nr:MULTISPECIES: MerR family transcriptional regulator [Anaerotruncus]NBH61222.1 MerR family transcriptional regulator [Anaerotruncus colihominis]NCF01877.1 MerR family transcriptional regulator [Anaerotruncus sp. 80]